MSSSTKHDDMLFEMLRDCRTLPIFLDEIFGFLYRRTDFYHVSKNENSAIGLCDGVAEQIIKHTFFKWKPKENITLISDEQIPAVTEETLTTSDNISIPNKDNTQFTSSECYNGSVHDNYSWSQTITDIDVIVKIPQNVTTKDLTISILPNKISVKLKSGKTILEGDFCKKCKHNDAIWSLDNRKLNIHLDKCLDMWWDCLVTNEPKLDLTKIDCSRPFEELPEEAQVKIEELQWNQERKRLGLPTSDELTMQETFRKSWNVDGGCDPTSISLK